MLRRRRMLAGVGIVAACCAATQLAFGQTASTPAAPAQTGPGQAAPLMPVRVGGAIRAPTRIVDAKPVYPEEAQRARVSGVVILEVIVDPTGHVQQARVLHGVPMLDQPAIDAVKQWQYTPTLLNGVPTPVIMTVTVNFAPQGAELGEPPPSPGLLSDAEAAREPFLIASGRAGVFQVGMLVDTLYRRIPSAQTTLVDLQQEGYFTPAIAIRLEPDAAQPAILASYRQVGSRWIVDALYVDDPRFRTVDGLGVGSTLADIQGVSPEARVEQGEGPFVALRDRGIVFRLTSNNGAVRRVSLRLPVPAVGRVRP